MKTFRSRNYLASVCLVLLFTVSQAIFATDAKPATSVLLCPQGPPTPGLTPQYGGKLTIINPIAVNNIGAPWKRMTADEGGMATFCIQKLLGLDPKGAPVPQLATSWVSDPDKKTVTLTLRKGVKFHDGTDFNAAAAKWNLDKIRTGATNRLELVSSVDVIDDYHIRLNLSKWDPLFVQTMHGMSTTGMISPIAARKLGDDIKINPVGTGPFKFVSMKPNVSLKFERFDGYWQKGLPYLDEVEIKFVANLTVALVSFTKGEAQVLLRVPPKDAKFLKDKGYKIVHRTSSIAGLCGDSVNPDSPFADIRVRRAIAHAIDNNAIANTVFNGFCPAVNQLAVKGGQGYDSTIKGYPFDPEKAKRLLAEAGYSTAKPLKAKCIYNVNAERTLVYTAVQGYLKKVGIDISLQPLNRSAHNKIRDSGWKNQLIDYNLSYNGLEVQYSTGVTQSLSKSKYRYASIQTPEKFQGLYMSMIVENDMAKREALYRKLNKMAIDDYCMVIPLYESNNMTAYSPKLHDMGLSNRAVGTFIPEIAWLSK